MSTAEKDMTRLPTNVRLLMILEVFASSSKALTPTEVNEGIGLPKQSIHRLCQTLLESGFLTRDVDPKRLRPARRARKMANGLLSNSHLHIARHQVLKQLSLHIGETVNFVIAESEGMRYTDRVDTDWPLRFQLPIGSHVPFHCTASGKTFLASVSKPVREQLIRSIQLNHLAINTITDSEALAAELHHVAAQGFAVDDQEFMDGMIAAAVPVVDSRGDFCAALAFHAPCQRVTAEQALAFVPELKEAARRLSALNFSSE